MDAIGFTAVLHYSIKHYTLFCRLAVVYPNTQLPNYPTTQLPNFSTTKTPNVPYHTQIVSTTKNVLGNESSRLDWKEQTPQPVYPTSKQPYHPTTL